MLCDIFLAHVQGVVRVVATILPIADVARVVDPATGIRLVLSMICTTNPLLAFELEDYGTPVELFDSEALMGREPHVAVIRLDIEAGVARIGFEEPEGVDRAAHAPTAGKANDTKFADLDQHCVLQA